MTVYVTLLHLLLKQHSICPQGEPPVASRRTIFLGQLEFF